MIDYKIRTINGNPIVDIEGEIRQTAETQLSAAFDQALAMQSNVVLLNFSGLTYMNSFGIGLLITLLIRAQRQETQLRVFGLHEHYREIFDLARLNEVIPIDEDEAQSLRAAR